MAWLRDDVKCFTVVFGLTHSLSVEARPAVVCWLFLCWRHSWCLRRCGRNSALHATSATRPHHYAASGDRAPIGSQHRTLLVLMGLELGTSALGPGSGGGASCGGGAIGVSFGIVPPPPVPPVLGGADNPAMKPLLPLPDVLTGAFTFMVWPACNQQQKPLVTGGLRPSFADATPGATVS